MGTYGLGSRRLLKGADKNCRWSHQPQANNPKGAVVHEDALPIDSPNMKLTSEKGSSVLNTTGITDVGYSQKSSLYFGALHSNFDFKAGIRASYTRECAKT